jgi:hypothetical protein
MEGFIVGFLAGVFTGDGVVVVGDIGRLRFLNRLAGWHSGSSSVGGTSLDSATSTFIVSGREDLLELLPNDGARLSDLEVVDTAKDSARFIF